MCVCILLPLTSTTSRPSDGMSSVFCSGLSTSLVVNSSKTRPRYATPSPWQTEEAAVLINKIHQINQKKKTQDALRPHLRSIWEHQTPLTNRAVLREIATWVTYKNFVKVKLQIQKLSVPSCEFGINGFTLSCCQIDVTSLIWTSLPATCLKCFN